MFKLITIINWIALALVAYVLLYSLLNPTKGGDAAANATAGFMNIVAITAFVVLLGLNLAPFRWAKYAGLAVVVLPFALILLDNVWIEARSFFYTYDDTHLFPDSQRKEIAQAILREDVDKVAKLLQEPVPLLNDCENSEEMTLLDFTVGVYSPYSKDWEKTRKIIQLLLAKGATINSNDLKRISTHARVMSNCPAYVLQFFLEQGADPNARGYYRTMPLLFEAILSSNEPTEKVKYLIEHGADLHATGTFDVETEDYSPLLFAAHLERWQVCHLLLQRGLDRNFRAPNGATLRAYINKYEMAYLQSQQTLPAELEALKKLLAESDE